MTLLKKKTKQQLQSYLINKYSVTLFLVIAWVVFFDKDDLLSQRQLRNKLYQLQDEKKYYQQEIKKSNEDINELKTNPENLEKFAREKYLMKKANEEIFVIIKDSTSFLKK
jgi:cell division protein DivIC